MYMCVIWSRLYINLYNSFGVKKSRDSLVINVFILVTSVNSSGYVIIIIPLTKFLFNLPLNKQLMTVYLSTEKNVQ